MFGNHVWEQIDGLKEGKSKYAERCRAPVIAEVPDQLDVCLQLLCMSTKGSMTRSKGSFTYTCLLPDDAVFCDLQAYDLHPKLLSSNIHLAKI